MAILWVLANESLGYLAAMLLLREVLRGNMVLWWVTVSKRPGAIQCLFATTISSAAKVLYIRQAVMYYSAMDVYNKVKFAF